MPTALALLSLLGSAEQLLAPLKAKRHTACHVLAHKVRSVGRRAWPRHCPLSQELLAESRPRVLKRWCTGAAAAAGTESFEYALSTALHHCRCWQLMIRGPRSGRRRPDRGQGAAGGVLHPQGGRRGAGFNQAATAVSTVGRDSATWLCESYQVHG